MREILFKAKREDNGKWVEGDSLHTRYDNTVLISNNERKRNKETMIREKAYIRAYRNKCRRRNVREIRTLDQKVQKEEV